MEGDVITLTCTTSGSKPAANIRWFRNDKEVQGKRAAWYPQPGAASSDPICIAVAETSLLSNWSARAAAVHCARVCALFLWPGRAFCSCRQTAWLVANVAAVVCNGAVRISFCDRGVGALTKCPVRFPRTCLGFSPCPGHPGLVLGLLKKIKNFGDIGDCRIVRP